MLDVASFRALLNDRLHGLDRCAAVELRLHGGESFFLRYVREIRDAYAICGIVPVHEGDGASPPAHIPTREAAIPYATIADLVVSARRFAQGHPAGFRGIDIALNPNGAAPRP